MGKILHHYTSADTFINFISKNNKLKVNHINNVNDPMEFVGLNFSGTSGGGKYPGDSYFKYEKIRFANGRVHSKLFLTCFSYFDNVEDSKITNNILENMWAHYSDSYKGICLVFNEDTILKSITDCNYELLFNGPVKYSDTEKFSASISTDNFKIDDPDSVYDNAVKEKYVHHLSYKNCNRSNEREYRILLSGSEAANQIFIEFEKPSSIILGLKYQLKHRDPIVTYCNRLNIPLYKMSFNSNSRKYESTKVDKKYFFVIQLNDHLGKLKELYGVTDSSDLKNFLNEDEHHVLELFKHNGLKMSFSELYKINMMLSEKILEKMKS